MRVRLFRDLDAALPAILSLDRGNSVAGAFAGEVDPTPKTDCVGNQLCAGAAIRAAARIAHGLGWKIERAGDIRIGAAGERVGTSSIGTITEKGNPGIGTAGRRAKRCRCATVNSKASRFGDEEGHPGAAHYRAGVKAEVAVDVIGAGLECDGLATADRQTTAIVPR